MRWQIKNELPRRIERRLRDLESRVLPLHHRSFLAVPASLIAQYTDLVLLALNFDSPYSGPMQAGLHSNIPNLRYKIGHRPLIKLNN